MCCLYAISLLPGEFVSMDRGYAWCRLYTMSLLPGEFTSDTLQFRLLGGEREPSLDESHSSWSSRSKFRFLTRAVEEKMDENEEMRR